MIFLPTIDPGIAQLPVHIRDEQLGQQPGIRRQFLTRFHPQ